MSGLARRDIWLLPLIAALTVVFMLAGAELASRLIWPEQEENTCIIADPVIKFRYKPNCSSTMKAAEGPWYTNDYNACGYRSSTPCGPVLAGTRRIAMVGFSVGEGYLVEYPHTIGARLADDLTAMCNAPVEVQNLAAAGYTFHQLLNRMDEALKLHPDVVLLPVVPYDIESELSDAMDPITEERPDDAPPPVSLPFADNAARVEPQRRLVLWLRQSRALEIAQHFLFRNRSAYLPLYLRYGDKADFLRLPFSAAWQTRLNRFELLVRALLARANNVPFRVVFVPQLAQVELMTLDQHRPGVDPHALPEALSAITARNGVGFVDGSDALKAEPRPELLYYQVDGHLSGLGQPIVARLLAERLRDEPDGPFASCRAQLAATKN
jgi:GDSL-like Lipase/Acylhydrolase family